MRKILVALTTVGVLTSGVGVSRLQETNLPPWLCDLIPVLCPSGR